MKFLLPQLMVFGFCLGASAQTRFVTLTTHYNGPTTRQLQLATNETAELVSFPYADDRTTLAVTKDGISVNWQGRGAGNHVYNPAYPIVVTGPAVIELRTETISMCTFRISPESFPPDKTLIIPEGTAGATVTLECSTNLVNWTSATNGFYTGTNSAKFFRIRAERAP